MATLLEFLRNGHLGEVRLGMRAEEVARTLGQAEAESRRRKPVYVQRFGALELTFMPAPGTRDVRLVSVTLQFSWPNREIPQVVRPTDWMPTAQTTPAEFQQFLHNAGIPSDSNAQDAEEYFVLDTGATVVFSEGHLHSIHFRRRDKVVERKQMTLSLPDQMVQRLKRRAQEQQVSVHQLVENLLKEAV